MTELKVIQKIVHTPETIYNNLKSGLTGPDSMTDYLYALTIFEDCGFLTKNGVLFLDALRDLVEEDLSAATLAKRSI